MENRKRVMIDENLKKAIVEALTDEKVLKKISEVAKETVSSEIRPLITVIDDLEYKFSQSHEIVSTLCFKHAICPRCRGRLEIELKLQDGRYYGYAFRCTKCGMEGWIPKDEVGSIEK